MPSARGATSPSPAEVGAPSASEGPPAANWEAGNFSIATGAPELAGCSTCCMQTSNQQPELRGGSSSYPCPKTQALPPSKGHMINMQQIH